MKRVTVPCQPPARVAPVAWVRRAPTPRPVVMARAPLQRVSDFCSECNGSMAGRPPNALVCANPECKRLRNLRLTKANGQRRRAERGAARVQARVQAARASDGEIDWPAVINRIAGACGTESAVAALDSVNRHRNRNGLPEVRL